jgi:hypothetical protein
LGRVILPQELLGLEVLGLLLVETEVDQDLLDLPVLVAVVEEQVEFMIVVWVHGLLLLVVVAVVEAHHSLVFLD